MAEKELSGKTIKCHGNRKGDYVSQFVEMKGQERLARGIGNLATSCVRNGLTRQNCRRTFQTQRAV